jgi:replicative DNA helicase
LARRRRLVKLGHRLAQQAGADSEVDALAAAYRGHLEDVEGGASTRAGVLAIDLVPEVLAEASSRRAHREETGEAVFGLRTGIPRLDRLLCGLNRGLYLLAGAPGVGKTSLGLQIALHIARERPVIYVTFENSAPNLVLKALCASASLKSVDVSRGFVDLSPLSDASAALAVPLRHLQVVEGDGSFTVGMLRALARRGLEQCGGEGPCLVVIDYLQLWAKVSRELQVFSDTRTKVDVLGGELISLARRLDSPILALSSQSRAGGSYGRGSGRAALDSLKESGDLEYSADVALFLIPDQDSQSDEGQPVRALELAIKKNRHGPTGSVALTFHADRGQFRETDTSR